MNSICKKDCEFHIWDKGGFGHFTCLLGKYKDLPDVPNFKNCEDYSSLPTGIHYHAGCKNIIFNENLGIVGMHGFLKAD